MRRNLKQFSTLLFLFSLAFSTSLLLSDLSLTQEKVMRTKGILEIRNKAVSNTSAPTTTLCAGRNADNLAFLEKAYAFVTGIEHPVQLRSIMEMQISTGCRISEVLQMKNTDFVSKNHVLVRSLKHSLPRVLSYSDSTGYIAERLITKSVYVFEMNRFYVYRYWKSHGFVITPVRSSKQAVTHSLRQTIAMVINDKFGDKSLSSDLLRHKSKNSIGFYI